MADREQFRGLWPQIYEFYFKCCSFSPLKMQKAGIFLFFQYLKSLSYIQDNMAKV